MKIIAEIKNGFPTKFGLPRQSGIIEELKSQIIFKKEYRNPDYIRGLEEFSHIWILWEFSENGGSDYPLVRPPRLGGNKRKGVFATRSPFRPNPIGISSVRLDSIEFDEKSGPILNISGADLMDGTPIYDIKPYLPPADCHTDAKYGFAEKTENFSVEVETEKDAFLNVPQNLQNEIIKILAEDPRPSYQTDENRVYGFEYSGFEVKFKGNKEKIIITSVLKL